MKVQTPRGISSKTRSDVIPKPADFPISEFHRLLESANNHRDRTLWCLLGSTGIRMSEALNLTWENIDIDNLTIFIENPDNIRFPTESNPQKLRFKGRAVSQVWFIPALKRYTFDALGEYLRCEYNSRSGHNFIFQSLDNSSRSRPYWEVSDAARVAAFKRAVIRANISSSNDAHWTPHSLRHMYGVYMLNYLPVPNGYGLSLKEVQRLMGHKNISSTARYAREVTSITEANLLFADQFLTLSEAEDYRTLPSIIVERLRQEAVRLEAANS